MFADREDADRRLTDLLDKRGKTADLVLVIPRGGLPVSREVADRLGAPLDVVVVSRVDTPDNPEPAVGAVAGDGSVWWNEDLFSHPNVGGDYLNRECEREAVAVRDKVSLYRGGDPFPDMAEKRMVVADDDVATDVTARACLRQAVAGGAEYVALAVPVSPSNTFSELEVECDTVVVVESSETFGAVGTFYHDFTQISDEEATTYLRNRAGEH